MLGRIIRDPKNRRAAYRIDSRTGEVLPVTGGLGPADDSHQPFKYRTRFMGKGPKGRPALKLRNKWLCEVVSLADQADGERYYAQECTSTKTGRSKLVKTKKSYKRKYNKKYRSFRKKMDATIRNRVVRECKQGRGKTTATVKACVKKKLPGALSRIVRSGYACRRTTAADCRRYRR
jgi:hypothetical protein